MSARSTYQGFAQYLKPRLAEKLSAVGLDVDYVRADGDQLFYLDDEGDERAVLDFAGGYGASLLGHSHPRIVRRAVAVLAGKRPFNAQGSVRNAAGRLAERLSDLVGERTGQSYRTTLASTGAEATEAAIKHAELERRRRFDALADALSRAADQIESLDAFEASFDGVAEVSRADLIEQARGQAAWLRTVKPKFFALKGGFHGKTSGALSITANPEFRADFAGISLDAEFIEPTAVAIRAAYERACHSLLKLSLRGGKVSVSSTPITTIAAFFIEPVQGEGGVVVVPKAALLEARSIADEGDFPLVFDEIQCGLGRTGAFLGSEWSGVNADYYLFSKALGGGVAKISAMLVDARRARPEFSLMHTSTFADDDFASEVALEVLALLSEEDGALVRRVHETGTYLIEGLKALQVKHPSVIKDVRGMGLMVGVELSLVPDCQSPLLRVVEEQEMMGVLLASHLFHDYGIRIMPTLSAPNTLRAQPSAYVERADIDALLSGIDAIATALETSDATGLLSSIAGQRTASVAALPERESESGVRLLPGDERRKKVAFLAHFLEPADIRHWDRMLGFDDEGCERLLDRTRPVLEPFVSHRAAVRGNGREVELSVVGVPFLSKQVMESFRIGDAAWVRDAVRDAVLLARDEGASVIGLGGYTSIATNNCRDFENDGLLVTSGNSLTAAAALHSVLGTAKQMGLSHRRVGIVGAMGNLGLVFAELLAPHAHELFLFGRPGSERRLNRRAEQIARQFPALEVRTETDLSVLRECNVVVSASNAPHPIVEPSHISERPVVICDVAAPGDVSTRILSERPLATVLKGGLARLPFGQVLRIPGMRLDPGHIFGCLAETLLLGLSNAESSLSFGSLTPATVRAAKALAREHSFSFVARRLDAAEIDLEQDEGGERVSVIP